MVQNIYIYIYIYILYKYIYIYIYISYLFPNYFPNIFLVFQIYILENILIIFYLKHNVKIMI